MRTDLVEIVFKPMERKRSNWPCSPILVLSSPFLVLLVSSSAQSPLPFDLPPADVSSRPSLLIPSSEANPFAKERLKMHRVLEIVGHRTLADNEERIDRVNERRRTRDIGHPHQRLVEQHVSSCSCDVREDRPMVVEDESADRNQTIVPVASSGVCSFSPRLLSMGRRAKADGLDLRVRETRRGVDSTLPMSFDQPASSPRVSLCFQIEVDHLQSASSLAPPLSTPFFSSPAAALRPAKTHFALEAEGASPHFPLSPRSSPSDRRISFFFDFDSECTARMSFFRSMTDDFHQCHSAHCRCLFPLPSDYFSAHFAVDLLRDVS